MHPGAALTVVNQMTIKIFPADKAFSLCVRERNAWCCERCGKYYPEDKRMGLHCSHYHGRGKWSTRLNGVNAWAHCFGCHRHLGSNPHEFTRWVVGRMGEQEYELLLELSLDTKWGRQIKRDQKQVAKHYREQHKIMLQARQAGEIGRVEFESWC